MLVNLFGNYPEIRVLDYIIDYLFEGKKILKEHIIYGFVFDVELLKSNVAGSQFADCCPIEV